MIQFRCWFCNRYWRKPDAERFRHFTCKCGEGIRVPRRTGRSSQPWSLKNWLARSTVYGGFCGTMGFLFGYLYCMRFGAMMASPVGLGLLGLFVGVPAVIGFLGGERAVGFLGEVAKSMARSGNTGGG